jgi:hypothetical protein
VAPDEGHGFARPVNSMAMFAAAEKFLAKYLGGRYQEGGTEEVVARLKEITVDPKTVALAKKVDVSAVGAPKLEAALQPGTYNYLAKIQMGGQSMDLKMSTVVKEEGSNWTATDTVATPMGDAVDVATLDKKTLAVLKRSAKQGPMAIDIEFQDNKATGKMNMGGQDRPISMDVGGPVFSAAGGAALWMTCLPLAEGYSTAFRDFDIQKQKVKMMQLTVAGSESVTVPAGTFGSFKLDVSSAEGGPEKVTVWVAKESRKVVKFSALIPEMGGATLVAELQ